MPGRRPGLPFRTDEQRVRLAVARRAGRRPRPTAEGALQFDHFCAGDEVVNAAAVGAENETVVGEREGDSDERDRADERGENGAKQKYFHEAGVGFVFKGNDLDAEDAFSDRLTASNDHPELNAGQYQHGGKGDHQAGAKTRGGREFFQVRPEAEAGAGGGEGHHDQAGERAREADHVVEDLREQTFAAAGQRRGLGVGLGERSGGGIGGRVGDGRWQQRRRAEFNVVAEAAPFFGAEGFGFGLEVGATGGDPIAKLVGGDRAIFFAVASDNGEHERNKTRGSRGVNGADGLGPGRARACFLRGKILRAGSGWQERAQKNRGLVVAGAVGMGHAGWVKNRGMDSGAGFCSRPRFQSPIPRAMTTPATPSAPQSSGDDRKLVAVDATYLAPSFEDKLHIFWAKNGTVVLALCGLVAVGILAKGGWDYVQAQKELDVQKAYATSTTSDQLKSFAAAHADHSLAGIAQLRLADEAYTAGKSADALAGYDKVVAVLKSGPLVARAQLGGALAKVQAGKAAEATTDLKKLVADTAQPKGARAEAAYHLTSLAAEAVNAADVQKYSDQLMQLDPSGPWMQRALMLRASVPAAPAAVTAPAKTETPAGEVKIVLPGK